ncbi:bifunctional UDP-N-acetylglucosamine diphosphorylase/glucosamine-1-phosphate N-acetyltransferase GlmU [Legionella dresdenensis]|uniref:Bifunctional protein GlmU n=1 Tax=Legionella dresdenensis TaxID=450200 RepID=A0ABV8CDH8_9GAMM
MPLHIVILAAGMGKRMFSQVPKVLHRIAGKPMLSRVVESAQQLNPTGIHIIYGHGGELIKRELADLPVNWVLQEKQLGTGHAVLQALPHIPDDAQVLILSGDVPLIQADTLQQLVALEDGKRLALLVAKMADPTGLGRIIRDIEGTIHAIIEEKDATAKQRQIKEIYSGICCAQASDLRRWLPALGNSNAQGEYYLTEIIAMAVAENQSIASLCIEENMEIQGVNNRQQLQQLERIWQQKQAERLLMDGVTLADAARFDLRGEVICGQDVYIDINCVLEGKVILGNNSQIGPNCYLNNVAIGAGCEIFANSVLENCTIGDNCEVGPFARIRPGTRLGSNCKIGNFVEAKNAVFGEHSKASHLSYIGDATIGNQVNIGAGTITCNYDGANKHQTIIEDGVFVGSDTQLIAPVRVGAHATIGAGSTIRKDVPAGELTLTDSRQKTVTGWKRPVKKEKM